MLFILRYWVVSDAQTDKAMKDLRLALFPSGVMHSVPVSISALGQLMIAASSVNDVSINYPPQGKDRFDYIEYPDSLRTTLLQIGNGGYKAFSAADLKMVNIQRNANDIGKLVSEIENLLKRRTSENTISIDKIVEMRINRMTSAIKKCEDESSEIVQKFLEMLNLMEEVQKACLKSNSEESNRFAELQKKKEEVTAQKEATAKITEYLGKKKNEIDNNLQGNRKQLEEMLKTNDFLWQISPMLMMSLVNPITWEFVFPIIAVNAGLLTISALKLRISEEAIREAELQRAENQKEQEKTSEDFKKLQDQLNKIDSEKVSYEEAIKILKTGVDFIGKALESWRKLHQFFALMKLDIGNGISKPFEEFTADMSLDINSRFYVKYSINDNIESMKRNSNMIGSLAKFYVEISQRYIMPAISRLNTYSAVDKEEKKSVKNQLIQLTDEAQIDIKKYFEEKTANDAE